MAVTAQPTPETASSASTAAPTLSVIVPAFNEERTVGEALRRVLALPISLEILFVNDGSTDRTEDIATELARRNRRITLLRHDRNRGKGAAIRTAVPHVRGKFVVIQDADLEFDPKFFLPMLKVMFHRQAQVVYGSRTLIQGDWRSKWLARLRNWPLSLFTSCLFGARIRDEATCYKMLRAALLRRMNLSRDGFDVCAEMTGKLLLAGHTVHDVPISYTPRSIAQGKKIRAIDALHTVLTLLRLKWQYVVARAFQRRTALAREVESLQSERMVFP